VQNRVNYKYIIGIVAIFFVATYLLSALLDDDIDDVISVVSTTKEIAKPEIKQELTDDYWSQNNKKIDINNKRIEKKVAIQTVLQQK
jgi:hypothetical protein